VRAGGRNIQDGGFKIYENGVLLPDEPSSENSPNIHVLELSKVTCLRG
jgi:hypothetical protein